MTTDPQIRKIIFAMVEKIKREYRPEKIILFGSYAYGRPGRDSDLDFLIVKQTSERRIDRRVAVAGIISELNYFIPVEPMVLTPGEIQEQLKKGNQYIQEILEKGEVLYGA